MARVKLRFFQGIRSCSYCFIKSDFVTINDLIKHIGRIFQIDYAFSLILNNFALPPPEDIKVVHDDDTILVMPDVLPVQPPAKDDNEIVATKEKKSKSKKKSIDQDCAVANDTDIHILKSKKRKLSTFQPVVTSSAKKVSNVETRIQCFNNLSNHSNDSTSNLKDSLNNNHPEAMQAEHIKKKHNKSSKKQQNKSQPSLFNTDQEMKEQSKLNNSVSNKCNTGNPTQKRLIQTFTPARNILPCTEVMKKINVVHNIVVYNDSAYNSHLEKPVETHQQQQQESIENKAPPDIVAAKTISDNESKHVGDLCSATKSTMDFTNNNPKASIDQRATSEIDYSSLKDDKVMKKTTKYSEKRLVNSVGNLLNNLRSNNHETTPPASCSSSVSDKAENLAIYETNFVTKRKRYRKKKPVHFDTLIPERKVEYHKPNVETKPLIHRFFDDHEEDQIVDDNVDESNGSRETTFQNQEIIVKDSTNQVGSSENTCIITENESLTKGNGIKGNIFNTEQPLTEEKINNLLKLDKRLPSSGDVIIFQILKLGLNYTPGASKHIIARVLSFDVNTQQIELIIQDGLSELLKQADLMGNEGEEEICQPDKRQVMDWKHILNPRLLSTAM